MAANKIGFYTSTALVIANMIGTGIFTSLGFETAALPSVAVLLLLWFCGGLIAICGGLSYIALSRLIPGSGGEYNYIKQSYTSLLAQVSGMISVVAGFSAPVALAAMAFALHLEQLIPALNLKIVAIILITAITVFHCFTIKLESRFQLLSTVLKLLLLLAFIICGLLHEGNNLDFTFGVAEFKLLSGSGFASSLVYVSFAYSGWNASTYIYNEIEAPLKNIRRSVICGTLVVTALYMMLNLVFLRVLPLTDIDGVVEVGALAALTIFGAAGGQIAALIISLLLLSTISAMIWVGPRVILEIAESNGLHIFRSKTTETPILAVLVQFAVTIGLLITGTFEMVLTYTVIVLNICSCLAVSVLFQHYKTQSWKTLIIAGVYVAVSVWSCIFLFLLKV